LTFDDFSAILYVLRVRDTEERKFKNMKNEMKTFRIETEDRYGRFNEYDIQAESLDVATATANERVNLPNGAFVMDIKEIPEVQESTQKIEGVTNYDNLWQARGYYHDDEGNDIRDRD
tara:strand:- start:158 stop:511 length:354 start_codon:yes stop_codon:yes gene_type:complete